MTANKASLYIAFIITTYFATICYGEPIVISHKSPETPSDLREFYNTELITLALEKTKPQYGDYKLVEIPPMNIARSLYTTNTNTYPNFLAEISYLDEYAKKTEITYINFPVDLGLTGYRICFVNPAIKEAVSKATQLDQLKKYTVAQGIGWSDIEILRHNGFQVIEVQSYDSMFKMVAAGRVDLYCRGINELRKEYETYKYITRLTYDESFALVYTMPRFFYLGSGNKAAKARMEAGLRLAYQDGSLLNLWHKHNDENLQFAALKTRRIFYLENPFIKNLSPEFKKYYFDPLK